MRFPFIDYLRVTAIVLMVFFHTFFDLTILQFLSIDFQKNPFWYWLPRLIVLLFLFCSGISLQIAYKERIVWPHFLKRFLKVSLGALVISVVTYLFYRSHWIYFGTLHCIAFATILGLLFLNRKWLTLLFILFLSVPPLLFNGVSFWPRLSQSSLDYIPLIPWGSCFLAGMFAYHWNVHRIFEKKLPDLKMIRLISRHSLLIYLLHQPLIYGIIYTLKISL